MPVRVVWSMTSPPCGSSCAPRCASAVVVGEASEGVAGAQLARQRLPDLVVLDLGLPDLAGREVLSLIRRDSPRTKVVVFSGTETADRAWLERQADGYVLKDADLDYLISLLEAVSAEREHTATWAAWSTTPWWSRPS